MQFADLTPAVCREIDEQALACPADPPTARDGPFFGGLAGWIASRAPLAAEEEVRRAEQAAAELETRFTITAAPEAAQAVLATLLAEVPPRLRPPPIEFSLSVIDVPQWLAFTPGGGRLFISRPYLAALLDDPERGPARLAFVLAHEIGHICRLHTRRAYQLLVLEDAARDEALDEVERARLRRLLAASIRKTREGIALLYSKEQDYEADLFAIHLCRNAGFDLEAGLDVLRLWAVRDEGESATDSPTGPVVQARHAPPALVRLKHLRHELDGVLNGESFGLFRFDRLAGEFVRTTDRSLPAGRRGVVLIHGMGSSLAKFVPLARALDELDTAERLVLLGFQYPGDASLARAARALTREMAAFGDDARRLDFVGHSAGGLVFRWYAEIEGGEFRQAIFEGTPHGGSDLARLREYLEVQQFVGDLRLGFREAIENVAADGDGQIGHDLQPDSLFLRFLDRGQRDATRYAIFRGHRFDGRRAVLLRSSTAALRSALRRASPENLRLGPLQEQTDRWIDRIKVPPEIHNGDLAVTLDSAALPGVSRIETVPASHHKLQQDPAVIAAVAAMVLSDEIIAPPAGVPEE
ncbi:MAG TPA: M48 family metalloprotease [Planctomycetaceae bacterium]|nr:M48 family metalloprotease [Planctomycetaceae bacterium]